MADHEVAPNTTRRADAAADEVALPFIGQWNRLISTTNWEKGSIICEWREAMMVCGEPVTEYSDEAWAQLVGGVTSQHVGRLRRVSQRFGDVADQYLGLFWSHFQAALDWDDAEMWLEGSLQNDWSVSQMRGKRWETLGTSPDAQRACAAEDEANLASEAAAEDSETAPSVAGTVAEPSDASITSTNTAVKTLADGEDSGDLPIAAADSASDINPTESVQKRSRLNVEVESLPDDLAEAFESFKLAIIAHRREGWRDTTVESVVECLDALRELALVDS